MSDYLKYVDSSYLIEPLISHNHSQAHYPALEDLEGKANKSLVDLFIKQKKKAIIQVLYSQELSNNIHTTYNCR